jgi:hypothetical protein
MGLRLDCMWKNGTQTANQKLRRGAMTEGDGIETGEPTPLEHTVGQIDEGTGTETTKRVIAEKHPPQTAMTETENDSKIGQP